MSDERSADGDYEPVSCRLYDELGLRMMRGQKCTLVIRDGDGERTVETVIEDVYTEGDAEYARLESGEKIRLDAIARVD